MTAALILGLMVVMTILCLVIITSGAPCGAAGKECVRCAICSEGGPSKLCSVCRGSGCSMHPKT